MRMDQIPTPAYIVDEHSLIQNLKILKRVMDSTGCRILLAQKAFSMFRVYPLIGEYLCGTTASSLFEARLGKEEMGGEVHIYAPAYRPGEMTQILDICDHIVFNSLSQWQHFQGDVQKRRAQSDGKKISCGLRINPEYAEVETELYNPCAAYSRLGVTADQLKELESSGLSGIDGLHFHVMCEQDADTLKRVLEHVEDKFGRYLYRMKWLNFGGGHHITRAGYKLDLLIDCILYMQEKYDLEIYLEPGEAIALNAGYLSCSVLDIVENGMKIAIVDTSAACHMPDVLEMPYRPEIIGAGKPGEKPYTYRLAAPTCLAGDIIGDYSFDRPLVLGERLCFCDMAIYTMVKNNTFNGVNLPSIALQKSDQDIELVKTFGYEDFKERLS